MDLDSAIDSHIRWKIRLRGVISGRDRRLSPEEAAADDRCELGRWIRGLGAATFRNRRAFQTLAAQHAAFHQCCGRIVALAFAGDRTGARMLLAPGGRFSRASAETVRAISAMQRIVERERASAGASPSASPSASPGASPGAPAGAHPGATAAAHRTG
jgi:hypothetical protein